MTKFLRFTFKIKVLLQRLENLQFNLTPMESSIILITTM